MSYQLCLSLRQLSGNIYIVQCFNKAVIIKCNLCNSPKSMANDYKILSEETLEKLICSNCLNYLSFGSSKIARNRIICERCKYLEEGILPAFNDNISHYLFPCINRFDGCTKLLQYPKVKQHEENCLKHVKNKCIECDFEGNGCQVYHHMLKEHPESILKYPILDIYLLDEVSKSLLYRAENSLVVLKYKVTKPDCVLHVSLHSLGQDPLPGEILVLAARNQQILRKNSSLQMDIFEHIRKHKENAIKCQFNVKPSPHLFEIPHEESSSVSRQLSAALKANLLPKLRCVHCKCYVLPPVRKCPRSHAICEHCYSSFCNACDDLVRWSRATDLETFHAFIPFACRWNCGTLLQSTELRKHEKTCPSRRYRCSLEWCSWSGSLDELREHSHNVLMSNNHAIYGFSEKFTEFYLSFDSEVFYCWMDALRADGRNIHVRKVSELGTSEEYGAEAVLEHRCNERVQQVTVKLKMGGIVKLKKNVIDQFGPCKNYKIHFKINSTGSSSRRYFLNRRRCMPRP